MTISRRQLAVAGGVFIVLSGVVSAWVGGREGYLGYQPDPAGIFGHVGVWAGLAAVLIGGTLVWIATHEPASPPAKVLFGLLTVVLGHLGAIAGALLVGTAGLLLSYVSGFWLIGRGIKASFRRSPMPARPQ